MDIMGFLTFLAVKRCEIGIRRAFLKSACAVVVGYALWNNVALDINAARLDHDYDHTIIATATNARPPPVEGR